MIGNGAERPVQNQPTGRPGVYGLDGIETSRSDAPPHPLEGIFEQIREVIEYARFYVEARKDMLRATLRGLILKAVVGIVAGLAGITVIIMAVVYLLGGIAHGLGLLFGDRFWLGELTTGLAIFLALIMAGWFLISSMSRKARERTVEKYERRQQQQRERFGHSATERAQQLQQSYRG